MQIPLQVTFEGTDPSDAAHFLIEQKVERLEHHNQRITGCWVKVIAPPHKHRHGSSFDVHIWMTLPPRESIVVGDKAGDDNAHESAASAIKHAFVLAKRQLDAYTHRA